MFSYIDNLNTAFRNAVSKLVENTTRCGVLFSGGIDSSIVASVASEYTDVTLYVTGVSNAHDIKTARSAAAQLNLPAIEIHLVESDIENAVPAVKRIISSINPVEISYELPLFFVAKNSREKILLSGHGADELFAGYAKYLNAENLTKELDSDLATLSTVGILKSKKTAAYFGKELRAPFLEPEVIDVCSKIPVEYKIKNGVRKYILREFGRTLGFPEEIITCKKKAAQYGSGIMAVMKGLAKRNGMNLGEYLEKI